MTVPREDLTAFADLIDERARISDALVQHVEETLGTAPGFLAHTSGYVLSSPGKLLRPLLLLDACRAVGGDPDRAFPAAVGTEYGHVASLIHDDIIDNDAVRHGQETLHAKYTLPAALLTGDFLIFQMFLSYTQCHDQGVSAERVLETIRVLSRTCIEICQGQALEATIAGHLDTTEPTYLEMIRLKTAGVCRAAAWIGAHLGGASDEAGGILADYGDNLGMAFQIIDDILSYDGSSLHTGKPVQSDVRNGRVTLPVIYAVQSADAGLRRQIAELFAMLPSESLDAHAQLVALLQSTHALERTRALAYRYTARAKACLDRLPRTDARERLRALADIALARDY